jgi:hypothetical protein
VGALCAALLKHCLFQRKDVTTEAKRSVWKLLEGWYNQQPAAAQQQQLLQQQQSQPRQWT